MGLFDFLSKRKKIMSYEIYMNSTNDLSVNVNIASAGLSNYEYLRLWAHYQCKVMYNLGFPNNATSQHICLILSQIISKVFSEKVYCFKRAKLDDYIFYSNQCLNPLVCFTGEFFTNGATNRIIKTYFPLNITEQQVLYSSIGLLQYALDKCSNNQKDLDIAWKLVFFLLVAFNNPNSINTSAQLINGVPEIGFLKALETDINDILKVTEKPSNNHERILRAYQSIGDHLISNRANEYMIKTYPTTNNICLDHYFKNFFMIGYNLRVAENMFSKEYGIDIEKIKHNEKTNEILQLNIPSEKKIEQIAEHKESNNTTCSLGPEVKDYSIIGFDLVNNVFSELLLDYMNKTDFFNILPEDIAVEASGRNAALGYCFRLSEEIVDAYLLKKEGNYNL